MMKILTTILKHVLLTLSAKSSLILGENKAVFCREGHFITMMILSTCEQFITAFHKRYEPVTVIVRSGRTLRALKALEVRKTSGETD